MDRDSPPTPVRNSTADAGPLLAAHTPNFPALLRQLGASLLVTTYQAGKLVMVRDEGDHLNTHYRSFPSPMGLALADGGSKLALGTTLQVWEFRDNRDVARRLEPTGRHDACFLPRQCHVTGNVQIHEMAYGAGRELWFVNTRFSCLATLDPESSFVPRWRPAFISGVDPDDRCHLNGLGFTPDGRCLVTALGETDSPDGWRAAKGNGGILLDVGRGLVLVDRLAMPHSPRAHNGRLWLLESGTGTFGYIDERAGRYEPIAALPGFTRGLSFHGDYAFIGLSQVLATTHGFERLVSTGGPGQSLMKNAGGRRLMVQLNASEPGTPGHASKFTVITATVFVVS